MQNRACFFVNSDARWVRRYWSETSLWSLVLKSKKINVTCGNTQLNVEEDCCAACCRGLPVGCWTNRQAAIVLAEGFPAIGRQ